MRKLSNEINATNKINDQNLPIRFALENVRTILCNKDVEKWNRDLHSSDKLRTYRTYKLKLEREWYCTLPLSRDQRRVLFKLRSCSLPLHVETGRFTRPKTPLSDRLCKFCNFSVVEDETHFLLDCDLFTDIRHILYEKALSLNQNFSQFDSAGKLKFIMQHKDMQFTLGNTISKIFL